MRVEEVVEVHEQVVVPEPEAREEAEVHELQHTSAPWLIGEFVGTAFLGFVGPDLLVDLPPEDLTCADAWCEPPGFDRAISNAFTPSGGTRGVGTASHVFSMGLSPVIALGSAIVPAVVGHHGGHAVQDSVIVVDAFLLSTGFNSVAKISARRQRPTFYFDREELSEAHGHEAEEFVSFYSGDTTWAFVLASSATTLSALRGYRHTVPLGIAAGTVALTAGTLRIVADMHWATDVLMGAATGTAVGVGLPLLMHRREKRTVVLVPSASGGLAVAGTW